MRKEAESDVLDKSMCVCLWYNKSMGVTNQQEGNNYCILILRTLNNIAPKLSHELDMELFLIHCTTRIILLHKYSTPSILHYIMIHLETVPTDRHSIAR